ncbi:unnamed protein product, partial [Urochloa humidicola]
IVLLNFKNKLVVKVQMHIKLIPVTLDMASLLSILLQGQMRISLNSSN